MVECAIPAQIHHVIQLLNVRGIKTTASQKQVAGLSTNLSTVGSVASPVEVFKVQAEALNINCYSFSD